MTHAPLTLTAGMPIVFGGDRMTFVAEDLAARFSPGDRLIVVQETGELLHLTRGAFTVAADAVGRACEAFETLQAAPDEAIGAFFHAFATRLAREEVWSAVERANAEDLRAAAAGGRSTTRLSVSPGMRETMIAGLEAWRDAAPGRGRVIQRIDHPGWSLDLLSAPLGVVGFVFESRPNVIADAAGVVRSGNAAVLRIGADALRTARSIVDEALGPALDGAGLPAGAVSLLAEPEHAAAWALFADPRLSLAVARGSGPAVTLLGAIARQAGTPVSLHGTGGAWIVADKTAATERFASAVRHSLDRKVCNTLNVCLIVRERAAALVPAFLAALDEAGAARGHGARLHVAEGSEAHVPAAWFHERLTVRRADGDHDEPRADTFPAAELGREWEWEETPEVSLAVVADLDEAIALFNAMSPRLAACLIAERVGAHDRFFDAIQAPFVGDGFSRWVDGQYALDRPELGISNWRNGRLLARGGLLTGDDIFTIRARMRQAKIGLRR